MHRSRLASLLCVALVPLLYGCGGDDDAVEPVEAGTETRPSALGNPGSEIPRRELYGAGTADNLWSPRIELEVLGLPAGWDGVQVAILSDFQLGLWHENADVAAAAVQRAVDLNPDIVVLLGDYVAEDSDAGRLGEILEPLRGRPAFAVLGDHDIASESRMGAVGRALTGAGVRILRDTAAAVIINEDTAWIAGVDASLRMAAGGDQNFIVGTRGVDGRTPILLTHDPVLAARAPRGRYPIVLAGNSYCGDVPLDEAYTLRQIADDIFPGGAIEGTERLFRVQGQTLLVTCGTGYGFVPLRFGSPPEVPILTLRRFGQPEAPSAPPDPEAMMDSIMRAEQEQNPAPQ